MTREEAKSCIGTIEMLQRLAFNIHGVIDVIDADNCKKIIKALEQEPKIGHKVSGDLLGGLYCSECMTYVNEYFNYCPHCGAKIESEDNE